MNEGATVVENNLADDLSDDKGGSNNNEAKKRVKYFAAGLSSFLRIAAS